MAELLMLIGISGCGKTTFAKRLSARIVSSDSVREELYGDENEQTDPGRVFALAHARVREALLNGETVVFDATNVTSFARNSLLDAIRDVPCEKTGVLFLIAPEVAISRQKTRKRQVPEETVRRQYQSLNRDAKDIPDRFDRLVLVT